MCAAVELHGQCLVADPSQRAGVAVGDAEGAVVACRHDAVAEGEGAVSGDERVEAEATGEAQVLASASIEVADVGAAVGDHQRLLAALGRRPPVIDECRPRRLGAGRGHDPAVVGVGAGEVVQVAVPQRRESVAIPRLPLAADSVSSIAPIRSASAENNPPAWISGS